MAASTDPGADLRTVSLPNAPQGFAKRMPRIALGTWKAEVGETRAAVISAIKDAGYRMIDTANDYGNEHEVGAGLQHCLQNGVVTRDELFVQCKLWNANMRPDLVRLDLLATLKDLQLDYVDSFIIHWPQCAPADPAAKGPALAWNAVGGKSEAEILDNSKPHNNNVQCAKEMGSMFPMEADGTYSHDASVHYTQTWKAMEKLVDEGLCKSIGISNFNTAQVMDLLANGCEKYRPTVLQNEVHLYLQAKDMLDFCSHHGIQLQAYSPLGSVFGGKGSPTGDRDVSANMFLPQYSIREHPLVMEIGKKYNKSAAQVALKYQLQRGVCVVAKSTNHDRIAQNIQFLDDNQFELTEEDMQALSKLNCGWRGLLWPQTAGHPDYPFKESLVGSIGAAKVPPDWIAKEDPRVAGA
ncbi:unnamed protein product [Amoebophrya sp. A120]|nr:unnamed protein product [Amoebophrya sp. A120]|eukprot:GSA120T00001882001.1